MKMYGRSRADSGRGRTQDCLLNVKNLGFPSMDQYGFSRAHRVLRFFGWRDALKVA